MVPEIKFLQTQTIPKGWGYELVIVNNDKYCGKILHFNKGSKFSMHYHLIKEETFYILRGKIKIYYPNLTDASQKVKTLFPKDIVHIYPGQPHQLEAIEDTEVIEFSTTHFDSDNYRIIPGDSQLKK